jgi:hypothetical protein
MHFEGAAAHWLQSVDRRIRSANWADVCSWIHDRFGRDQHESLIRQLFHIKQTSTVQDYIDRLTELVDQLVAYEHSSDHRYYTTCFIDGLKDDVKSVVLVQRPVHLDTTCTLALLQEEADAARRREIKKPDLLFRQRQYTAPTPTPTPTPLSLPPPPPSSWDESMGSAAFDVKQGPDATRFTPTNKLSALRAYRKARGLCQFCAEKWSRGHKCAPTVLLQAVQEVWELLQPDFDATSCSDVSDSEAHLNLLLSQEAMSVGESSKTFKFLGSIQGHEVLILVDSGSSHSFLNVKWASSVSGLSSLPKPLSVQVAYGQVVHCGTELPQAVWSIQGGAVHL